RCRRGLHRGRDHRFHRGEVAAGLHQAPFLHGLCAIPHRAGHRPAPAVACWKLNTQAAANPGGHPRPFTVPPLSKVSKAPKEFTMKRILLLGLPFALMTACSNPPAVSDEAATAPAANAAAAANIDAALLGTNHWTLESASDASGKRIDGLFVRADKPVTLDFSNGRITVGNTCNHLGGSYTLEGGTLEVGSMISTQMACAEPGVMALDRLVSERLQGKLEVRALDATGLTLVAANGDVLGFRGEPTAETRYGG